jgi:hypothetical protein
MRPNSPIGFLFLACCLGLPAGRRICNQREIEIYGPTLVCFRAACAGLFEANFSKGVRSIAGTTVLQAAAAQQLRLAVRSNSKKWNIPLSKPMSAEEAETETRHQFAVRANSILAFIECDEEQRPKLRKAIIEAMLWAQTQPKLTG